MIIADLETTKLAGALPTSLKKQPKIIEICLIKLDDVTLKEVGRFHTFIQPGETLDPFITKLTKISDEMLKDAPTFPQMYEEIAEFVLGERILIAHNLSFDASVLRFELERMEKAYQFPWPMTWICTVENSMDIKGKRMKQNDLYEHYTGEEIVGTHRADADTEALCTIVGYMIDDGRIVL